MKRIALLLVLLAACKSEAEVAAERIRKAKEGCRGRYDAIQRYISSRGTVPQTDEELREAAANPEPDPWGSPYIIDIEGSDVLVISKGPDLALGTEDDLMYPESE